ncbi:hypothetical protein ACOSQ3_016613 [Xanthoceras sorbifolium]
MMRRSENDCTVPRAAAVRARALAAAYARARVLAVVRAQRPRLRAQRGRAAVAFALGPFFVFLERKTVGEMT